MNISVKPTDWRIKFQRFGIGIYILIHAYKTRIEVFGGIKYLAKDPKTAEKEKKSDYFYRRFIGITNFRRRRLYSLPKRRNESYRKAETARLLKITAKLFIRLLKQTSHSLVDFAFLISSTLTQSASTHHRTTNSEGKKKRKETRRAIVRW